MNKIRVFEKLKSFPFYDEDKKYNYGRKRIKDWTADDFYLFIINHLNGRGYIGHSDSNMNIEYRQLAIAMGLDGIIIYDKYKKYNDFEKTGSGYNNNIEYNKYKTIKSALHDVWYELNNTKKSLFDTFSESNEISKEHQIRNIIISMINESNENMIKKIDKVFNSGAIDLTFWDINNNPMLIPKSIMVALLENEKEEYTAKGTSFEHEIKKESKNISYFI